MGVYVVGFLLSVLILDFPLSMASASSLEVALQKIQKDLLQLSSEITSSLAKSDIAVVREVRKMHGLLRRFLKINTVEHGNACIRNDQCRVKESVCFEGVCLCAPGLYYNPTQDICVIECTEYGDMMDVYKGAGIVAHNDKSVRFVSEAKCIEACVQERNFTCLTIDMNKNGYCHLSKTGYLDVVERDTETGLASWNLAQRRCK